MATFVIETYGVFRRLAQADEIALELEQSVCTVQYLLDRLAVRYPSMAQTLQQTACAVDDELVSRNDNITAEQRLALIPPVSGGQGSKMQNPARLSEEELDLQTLLDATADDECGALVVFGGTIRLQNEGRQVTAIDYTAHKALAEKVLHEIEQETKEKFSVAQCRLAHRLGHLELGELSVLVVVRAGHRPEAFEAARWAIDTLKQRAPIWKEEFYTDGDSDYLKGVPLEEMARKATVHEP